jgi:hypothetical protein
VNNIKIDLKEEIGLEDASWVNLIQDKDHWQAVINTVMKLLVPQKIKNLTR